VELLRGAWAGCRGWPPFFLAGFAASASAQTAPTLPAPAEATERLAPYVVLGSNVPEGANAPGGPLTVFDADAMQVSGNETDLLDILRKISPEFSGLANIGNENAQVGSVATYGGAEAAIHNLTTLVLINGRRTAFDPAESQGALEFFDLNVIPPEAIDRVEVLTGGASALYGSDAVGGVINVILKSNADGWEVGAHYGFSPGAGNYAEHSFFASGGATLGGTSLTITVDYAKSDPLLLKQRSFSDPIFGSVSYPGVLEVFSLANGSDNFYRLNPAFNAPPAGAGATIAQLVAAGVYTPITATQALDGFNSANAETLMQSLERESLAADLDHRFGDSLEGFGDLLFSDVVTQSQLNGQPLQPYVSTPYTDLEFAGVTPPPNGATFVPVSAPTNPFSTAFLNGASDGMSGNLVLPHDRLLAFPRIYRNESTYLRGVAGLRGRVGDAWSWEAGVNLNQDDFRYDNHDLVDTANLNAAMADGVLNPFAYTQTTPLPPSVIGTASARMISDLNSCDILVRGAPLKLPAGPVGLAAGLSGMRETLSARVDANSLPDPLTGQTSGWSDANSLQPFSAGRSVGSVFAEADIPLIGPEQKIAAVHELDLDLAGRWDQYSGIGSAKTPRLGLGLEPIDSEFKLQATLSRAFVAPPLYELHGPSATGTIESLSFNNYGGGTTQDADFNAVVLSNPQLAPATANVATLGFDWAPRAFPGFHAKADYFSTVEKNIVGSLSPSAVAQSVELLGASSPYASKVHFGSPTGPGPTGPGQLSTAVASGVYIDAPYVNQASEAVRGFDAQVSYGWTLASIGRFDVACAATVYNSFRLQQLPTEDYFQYAGHVSSTEGTLPRCRTYTTVEWKRDRFGLCLAQTFIPSVTDIGTGGSTASPPVQVASYSQFDASASCRLGPATPDGHLPEWTLRVGVDNMFNRLPPVASNVFPDTNADLGTYGGAIGLMWFMDSTWRFGR
jgi:iron complex outermembrane receptor protein